VEVAATPVFEDWRFNEYPTGDGSEFANNTETGAPYMFWQSKNSWIFYVPGTKIPEPPVNPYDGNIWINAFDDETGETGMYLMYVFNFNEMAGIEGRADDQWYALTSNKRAYDYLVLPTIHTADDKQDYLDALIDRSQYPEAGSMDPTKQAYLYYNVEDGDIKVLNSTSDVQQEWISVTQHTVNPVDDPDADFSDVVPASALRVLKANTTELQEKIDNLRASIEALP